MHYVFCRLPLTHKIILCSLGCFKGSILDIKHTHYPSSHLWNPNMCWWATCLNRIDTLLDEYTLYVISYLLPASLSNCLL